MDLEVFASCHLNGLASQNAAPRHQTGGLGCPTTRATQQAKANEVKWTTTRGGRDHARPLGPSAVTKCSRW